MNGLNVRFQSMADQMWETVLIVWAFAIPLSIFLPPIGG